MDLQAFVLTRIMNCVTCEKIAALSRLNWTTYEVGAN